VNRAASKPEEERPAALGPLPHLVIKQEPGSAETRAAGLAAMLLGIPSRAAKLEDLAGLSWDMGQGALPVGSVEFVREAMRVAKVQEPPNMTYPQQLGAFLGREMRLTTAKQARAEGAARFVKPCATKAFTGFVHDPSVKREDLGAHEHEQCQALLAMPDDAPVWIGPVVEFVAEWRAYMREGKVLGMARYDPDGPDGVAEPAKEWIESQALPWLGAPGSPVACAVDVGRLSNGDLVLVEANDAWALGLYGRAMDPKAYLAMLASRWSQIMASPLLAREEEPGHGMSIKKSKP
jgi:hypothetical protein